MKKVSLLFGIHMHQPVDNFKETIQKAVELCYEPFFETVMHFSDFKFSLHCSGWLLDTIKKDYPELFEYMQILTQNGNIEWFSGGYYEPVLSSIPSKDRIAQIKKLNKYIKKHFNVKPRGLWLTERVWEASIIKDLKKAEIEYLMVDDYHFLSNRYNSQKLNGYYIAEENNKYIALFPISKKLRYALPFSEVKDSIEAILEYQKEQNSAAIIFDDAEKFGLWPETNNWVYKKKWLEKFIKAVLENENITLMHYKDYFDNNVPLGLAYLDNCSYAEMGEWSLKTDDAIEFIEAQKKVTPYILKGGIWKNFFIKYHESNYLHKRVLYLSAKKKNFKKSQKDALYRAETNDAFWHGVFGGFYLPNLRDNAYRYIFQIEQKEAKKEIKYEIIDIDKDGFNELKVLSKNLSIVISARNGAQMVEFGSLESLFNWQNTIMRRKELYHVEALKQKQESSVKEKIATIHNRAEHIDKSLKKELIFDNYAKNSFIDHFSDKEFTLENFKNATFKEVGTFVNSNFKFENGSFFSDGAIILNDLKYRAKMKKEYKFYKNRLELNTSFESDFSDNLYFAQEFNFHFAHPYCVTFNGKKIKDGFSQSNIDRLIIKDDFTKKTLLLKVDKKCNVYGYILKTVSKSEKGFEEIAQQISFIFTTSFKTPFKINFSLEVHNV